MGYKAETLRNKACTSEWITRKCTLYQHLGIELYQWWKQRSETPKRILQLFLTDLWCRSNTVPLTWISIQSRKIIWKFNPLLPWPWTLTRPINISMVNMWYAYLEYHEKYLLTERNLKVPSLNVKAMSADTKAL